MKEKTISIIVPIYRVEKYLRRCLDSILGQTFKDFELFLVDDGSPDKCGAICDEYAQRDSRIKVIHKENGGLSSARNVALDVATGDYVMFVDSDDWVEPDFCMQALRMIDEHNVQVVAFGHCCVSVDQRKLYDRVTKCPRLVESSEAIRHLILRDDAICNYSWNKIYKRSLFENIRYPLGLLHEDDAVTYQLIAKAKKIYVSDVILYNYLIRKDSISGIWFYPKAVVDRFSNYVKRLEDVKTICPENTEIQMIQTANEAVEGFVYLDKNGKYGSSLEEMRAFLSKNKDAIMKSHVSFKQKSKIVMYYYARIFLPMIKIVRKMKDLF